MAHFVLFEDLAVHALRQEQEKRAVRSFRTP